jgi:hypothetical protein
MSKQSSSFSVPEFITLLRVDPRKAYNLFVQNGKCFNSELWDEYRKLDIPALSKSQPEFSSVYEKFVALSFFAYLNENLNVAIRDCSRTIQNLRPTKQELLRNLYLILELSDNKNGWPSYTPTAIRAIKRIVQKTNLKYKAEEIRNPSKELFNTSLALLNLTIDQLLVSEFVDLFIWADFQLEKEETGWILKPKAKSRQANLFINNIVKSEIKKSFLKRESQSLISSQKHFLKNDPEWKSNEGFLGAISSKGTKVKPNTPGVTALEVRKEIFEKLKSTDPAVYNEGVMWLLWFQAEQNFHVNLRNALSEVFLPNDVVDVNQLKIPFSKDIHISIYDFFCIISCLASYASTYHDLNQSPYSNLATIKPLLYEKIKKDYPQIKESEVWVQCDSNIVLHYNDWEKYLVVKPLISFDRVDMLEMLRKVEELKAKQEEELITILDFLSNPESTLPFTPIYKLGNRYYFSFTTGMFNLNRAIYDAFVAQEIFNSYNKDEVSQKRVGVQQSNREALFRKSLRSDLSKVLTKAEAIERPGNSGEFDMVGYCKEENALLVIQVKLSNTSPFTEKRKSEWTRKHLTKAVSQIERDLEFLNSDMGVSYVFKKLKVRRESANVPKVYPLIVTDNFYADHQRIKLSNGGNVNVVSYFELKNLLMERVIDERQTTWELDRKMPIAGVIRYIEANTFWAFVGPLTKHFHDERALLSINDKQFSIRMRI